MLRAVPFDLDENLVYRRLDFCEARELLRSWRGQILQRSNFGYGALQYRMTVNP